MLDYSEKRDFLRMNMECPARFRADGAEQTDYAVVENLSATGVLLKTEKPVEEGIQLSLEVMPGKTITPPLSAYVTVLRCSPHDDGNFSVACTIEQVLQETEIGPDFP